MLSPTSRTCSSLPAPACWGPREHPVDIAATPTAAPAELVPIVCMNWRLFDVMVLIPSWAAKPNFRSVLPESPTVYIREQAGQPRAGHGFEVRAGRRRQDSQASRPRGYLSEGLARDLRFHRWPDRERRPGHVLFLFVLEGSALARPDAHPRIVTLVCRRRPARSPHRPSTPMPAWGRSTKSPPGFSSGLPEKAGGRSRPRSAARRATRARRPESLYRRASRPWNRAIGGRCGSRRRGRPRSRK